MAIARGEYKVIRDLKIAGILPERPHVIELGESNWYGSVSCQQLEDDIKQLVVDQAAKEKLLSELASCQLRLETAESDNAALFDIAKIFYRTFLDYESLTAVDMSGTDQAVRQDLNHPLSLDRKFDLMINMGTAEHVFNVYQVFKTVHEITKPGCLMIHDLPFHGWVDHGFYNFQPTFYFDLAVANQYEILAMIYIVGDLESFHNIASRDEVSRLKKLGLINGNCMIYTVMRKHQEETPFCIPQQGYYAGDVSEAVKEAWEKSR